MRPFRTLTSVAAPFPEAQIDTDVIFPARFLLLPDKAGLGRHLFHERRAKGGFVLDRAPWDRAEILVTGPDFGTGSSREQAVWALADFGIRCVIGPSFGEIFFSNCFRNGVLPVVLAGDALAAVMETAAAGEPVTVDLAAQEVRIGEVALPFDVEPHRKRALMEGLDEIGVILNDDLAEIEAFEARHWAARPWLRLTPGQLATFDDLRRRGED
jgi:3-isopropylmalate/(R)-2-methylmalate dehydratase small subunit